MSNKCNRIARAIELNQDGLIESKVFSATNAADSKLLLKDHTFAMVAEVKKVISE